MQYRPSWCDPARRRRPPGDSVTHSVEGITTGASIMTNGDIDMFQTCEHHLHMSRMIQIRNVPDDVHRRLKARAALAGMSMSDFVLREVELSLSRPTRDEVFARIAELPPVELDPSVAEILGQERGRS